MKENIEIRTDSKEFYTLDQLVEKTGTNKRTIAYYIQLGLLPGVGRRGRRTVYPADFLTKLKILNNYNEERDKGRFADWTLGRVKKTFNNINSDMLAKYRNGLISFQHLGFFSSFTEKASTMYFSESEKPAQKTQNSLQPEITELFEKLSAVGQCEQEPLSVQSQLSAEILPNVLISVKTDNTEEARITFNKLVNQIRVVMKNKEEVK